MISDLRSLLDYADTDHLRAINSLYYDSLLKMSIYMQQKSNQNLIWYPSINCYGFDILPEYKMFAYEKILHPEEASKYKPKNNYLRIPQCLTKSGFDPSLSHYFLIDGNENPDITHTNLKWIIKELQQK